MKVSDKLIALSGGIGSGKTVVSRVLMAMGYEIYDCDSRAKMIMDTDACIKQQLRSTIGEATVRADGTIDRAALAAIVFNDTEKLRQLNSIVHGAVISDLTEWSRARRGMLRFVETAILYESGIDAMVDEVWLVKAPEALRIARVQHRSGMSAQEVCARIKAQDITVACRHPREMAIYNDEEHSLLLQLDALL